MTQHLVELIVHSSEDESESETPKKVGSVGDPNLTESENTDLETTESDDDKSATEAELVNENVDPSGQFSRPSINTRALHKDSLTYELEKFEKNALIIFNQEYIDGHPPRFGTEKDVEALTKTFQNFGFEITIHKDLTKNELFVKLKTFSERDFTDYGCVAVAVLTHGDSNGILMAKDKEYSEIKIINMFKEHGKPTLVTKPKIIIIQACRGTKFKPGVRVFEPYSIQMDLDEEDLEPYILPVESDLLILHSSYHGTNSHRNKLTGSWFIQALCKNINSLASSHDLECILVAVKRDVAINKTQKGFDEDTMIMQFYKQMPVMTSTLIRKLYLRKFGEEVKQETHVDQLNQPSSSRRLSQSRHEFLDTVSTPGTPMLVQYDPSSNLVDHFTYMKTCLKNYVEQNPDDEIAINILEIANACEDGASNNIIDQTSKTIGDYLHKKSPTCEHTL